MQKGLFLNWKQAFLFLYRLLAYFYNVLKQRFIIAGGGAAGFFAAIAAIENGFPGEIIILEKSLKLLAKVLVSGGGRCNLTHACFDNEQLAQHYPRGSKELRGPFSVFNTSDTIRWFESKGVQLKTEADGRIFPVTNNSHTIANCLLKAAENYKIKICKQSAIAGFVKKEAFEIHLTDQKILRSNYFLIATGGSPKPEHYKWITSTGHTISSPVPSLFTFNVPDSPFKGLEGITVPSCTIKIISSGYKKTGPLLITHWGLSGPGILKLSALAARWVFEKNYVFTISISFLPETTEAELLFMLTEKRITYPNKKIINDSFTGISQRLWERLCIRSQIKEDEVWAHLKKEKLALLGKNLLYFEIAVSGKTTFKEEFVTCGGVNLREINLRTMESKLIPDLYFAGEIINIDGVTGGFNFQNAWTTGWIAGKSIGEKSRL